MGCDIHFYVEYKKPHGDGWEADKAHRVYCDGYIDRNGVFQPPSEDDDYDRVGDIGSVYKEVEHEGKKYVIHDTWSDINVGRNYNFFGFLADVRSSAGTAPIPRRGLPDGLSKEIKKASDDWSGDGHSHSYLSLSEFKEVVRQYRETAIQECKQQHEEYGWAEDIYQPLIDYIEQGVRDKSYKCPEGLFDTKAEARVVFWFDN